MGISYTIYEKHGFFVSSWVGAISDSDLLPSYKKLLENEKFKPRFHEIADMRNAQMVGVTGEGLRRLSSIKNCTTAAQFSRFPSSQPIN